MKHFFSYSSRSTAASTNLPTQEVIHIDDPVLSDKHIITKAVPGISMGDAWPNLTDQQRLVCIKDLANIYVQMARSELPVSVAKRNDKQRLLAPGESLTASIILEKEIRKHYKNDLVTLEKLLRIQHILQLRQKQDGFSDRLILDHNDLQPRVGNILVDSLTGKISGVIGEQSSYRSVFFNAFRFA